MKNIPNKLFLVIGDDAEDIDNFNNLDHEYVCWSKQRTDVSDIEYVHISDRDKFAIEKVDNVLSQLTEKIKPFKEDALNTCAELMKQGKDETEEFNVAAALNSHYSIMLSYIKSFHSQKQTQG